MRCSVDWLHLLVLAHIRKVRAQREVSRLVRASVSASRLGTTHISVPLLERLVSPHIDLPAGEANGPEVGD